MGLCCPSLLSSMHTTAAALTAPGIALAVEDPGLYVAYSSRGGGRNAAKKADHLRNVVDHFMIAHNNSASSNKFTCNTRVTVDNWQGSSSQSSASSTGLMTDVPYAGASKDCPDRVMRFLINR